MKFKKGDRILFNRLRFGNVYLDQTDPTVVHVTLDGARGIIQSVRYDAVELVSDPVHEAILARQINAAWTPDGIVAGDGLKVDHTAELKNKLDELISHYEGLADCIIEGQEIVDHLHELKSLMP